MLENFYGVDVRPLLLIGEIAFAYVLLMAFATKGDVGPKADFDQFFYQLSKIARHVVLTFAGIYLLTLFPKDTPAGMSAFIFAECIALIYLVSEVGVAAQTAVLLKYRALFEPEPAWEKLKKMQGVRLFTWFIAMDLLLTPLLVDAPKELRARARWTDIRQDAEKRALDRRRDPHTSRYNRDAERFLPAVHSAIRKRHHINLGAAVIGTLLLVSGLMITGWLLRGV